MRTRLVLAASALVLGACGGSVEIPDDVPAPTRAAIIGAFDLDTVDEIEREEGPGGVTWWEVEAPSEIEVYFDAAGTVPKLEASIPLLAVPEPIRSAGAREPGVEIVAAEVVVLDGALLYELEFEGVGYSLDVYYEPDGTEVMRYTEPDESAEGSGM